MINEQFTQLRSPVHGIDPRFRIVAAALFSVQVAVTSGMGQLTAALMMAVALIAAARLPLFPVLRRLALVNGFVLFLWLFLPFTTPGDALLRIGPLTLTMQGLSLAGMITLKSNAIVMTVLALIGTIPVAVFGHALQRLKVPGALCHLLLLTYRYLFVIEQEYLRMVRAMRIRGFVPRTDRHTYRSVAYLMGMLLVRTLERAERVHQAMLCRGFKGAFHSLAIFSVRPQDWLFAFLMLLAMTVLGLLARS
jgi:cobalt/nickel transport system permease protein